MKKCSVVFLLAMTVITAVLACKKTESSPEINVTSGNVAIKGYDPVAYFMDMKPVKGSQEFEYSWKGAKWRFSNEEHRGRFKSDPEKYAPRYGGYCAYAVSQGTLADIDPDAWTIYEGRLYLNLNTDVQRLWEKDMPGYILKADENWPGVLNN